MIKMYRRFIIIPMLYYLDALLEEILYLSDTKVMHQSRFGQILKEIV